MINGERREEIVTPPTSSRRTGTLIFLLSTIPSLLTLSLLYLLRSPHNSFRIPLFDDSSALLSGQESTGVRWDAIHFTSIASKGYEYEQQLAFQPGWQGVLWLSGWLWRRLGGIGSINSISNGGTLLVVLLAGWRGLAFYK